MDPKNTVKSFMCSWGVHRGGKSLGSRAWSWNPKITLVVTVGCSSRVYPPSWGALSLTWVIYSLPWAKQQPYLSRCPEKVRPQWRLPEGIVSQWQGLWQSRKCVRNLAFLCWLMGQVPRALSCLIYTVNRLDHQSFQEPVFLSIIIFWLNNKTVICFQWAVNDLFQNDFLLNNIIHVLYTHTYTRAHIYVTGGKWKTLLN